MQFGAVLEVYFEVVLKVNEGAVWDCFRGERRCNLGLFRR